MCVCRRRRRTRTASRRRSANSFGNRARIDTLRHTSCLARRTHSSRRFYSTRNLSAAIARTRTRAGDADKRATVILHEYVCAFRFNVPCVSRRIEKNACNTHVTDNDAGDASPLKSYLNRRHVNCFFFPHDLRTFSTLEIERLRLRLNGHVICKSRCCCGTTYRSDDVRVQRIVLSNVTRSVYPYR